MNGSQPGSFWVVSLETMSSANLTFFFFFGNLLLLKSLCVTHLVFHLAKFRSLRLEWQTFRYLSLLYLHIVHSPFSLVWIKCNYQSLSVYIHYSPEPPKVLSHQNVFLCVAYPNSALSLSVSLGPIFHGRHFLNISGHTDLPFSWTSVTQRIYIECIYYI